MQICCLLKLYIKQRKGHSAFSSGACISVERYIGTRCDTCGPAQQLMIHSSLVHWTVSTAVILGRTPGAAHGHWQLRA